MLPPNRADAGTRRRGDDEAATTTASLPLQPPGSQSLQPPRSQSLQCPGRHRSFRRHYSPSLAAAPSLQVPSQSLQPPSLTGLTAPLTQEGGWWRRGRRRDDDDATTSSGGRDGAERTEGDALTLGMGAQTADHWVQSARGAAGLAGHQGGDAARHEPVGRHPAGQAGAVPTGSQRLPLANNRLREVLLSRPNGELTRAGQFCWALVEGPLEARGAAPHPLGPIKKPGDGSHHLTKTHAKLLRHTRLCHAITYASCQGLTLRGRVHLCDTSSPHFFDPMPPKGMGPENQHTETSSALVARDAPT
eukprot:s11977_g2.t1